MYRLSLVVLGVLLSSGGMASARELADGEIKSVPIYPKAEVRSIEPKVNRCDPACDPVYRIPPEQLQRMRELDGSAPGTIIHMTPREERREPKHEAGAGRSKF